MTCLWAFKRNSKLFWLIGIGKKGWWGCGLLERQHMSRNRRTRAMCFVAVCSLDALWVFWSTGCWMCLVADVLVAVAIPLHAPWRWINCIFAESDFTLQNPAESLRGKGLFLLPHGLSNCSDCTSGFSHLFQNFFYFFLHPLSFGQDRDRFPLQTRSGMFKIRGLLHQCFATAASVLHLHWDSMLTYEYSIHGIQLKVQRYIQQQMLLLLFFDSLTRSRAFRM